MTIIPNIDHKPYPLIEELMLHYAPVIGDDVKQYKNHVYRMFLYCLLLDRNKDNVEKYAIAAVFHDLGIWTYRAFDYLTHSIEQASDYLAETGRSHLAEEIGLMICWHHKTGIYEGQFITTVETFRKADWIDVSLGWQRFGLDMKKVIAIREKFPSRGFAY